VVDVD